MEWLVLGALCFLCAWYIHRDLKLEQIADLEEKFRQAFPGKCPRCSFNRWALAHGKKPLNAPHKCDEA